MNALRMGRVLPGVALLCLFSACGSSSSDKSYYSETSTDSVSYAYDPGTTKIPEEKLMVRKAAMNFKVKELQKTSQKISSITTQFGGEVWNSHLQTVIQNSITKKISADSLLEVITYRQTNELSIRVPSKNLDSLLISLEGLSQLLHDKEITTENVSLEYLSNELKSKNMARIQESHEAAMESKKANLEKYTSAGYENATMQNEVIDRQIHNMSLLEKVNYSTVKLSIYQDTEAYKNTIADFNSDQFEPAFGSAALMSLQDGWDFILGVVVFLLKIWPLYLFGLFVFLIIRYAEKNRLSFLKKTI